MSMTKSAIRQVIETVHQSSDILFCTQYKHRTNGREVYIMRGLPVEAYGEAQVRKLAAAIARYWPKANIEITPPPHEQAQIRIIYDRSPESTLKVEQDMKRTTRHTRVQVAADSASSISANFRPNFVPSSVWDLGQGLHPELQELP